MRINLKGVHTVKTRLADGARKTYHYAWRGGPRLTGAPGSAEFIASYHEAHRNQTHPSPDLFRSIIADYKASADFTGLRERTRADYLKHIKRIEDKFGEMPIAALEDPRVTQSFLKWRDGMANSPRQADYGLTVLWLVLNWARARGLTTYRPPARVKRLYKADRAQLIWEPQDIAKFLAVAPTRVQHAMVLAMETGQRQGDLLTLSWNAYDGEWIELRQAKTARRVRVPVSKVLRPVLESIPRAATTILTDSRGQPWKPNSFRRAWRAATRAAGISKLTFHDVRGTAVTRLAEEGCTPQEVAAITGHSQRDVGAILDRYTARTDKLAVAAITKLDRNR